MPVVLMFDGPSLGGFVCPATITSSELWKMGQVAANDTVEFKRVTLGASSSLFKFLFFPFCMQDTVGDQFEVPYSKENRFKRS